MNSLLQVLEEHLSFSEISSPFMNIITGQIYSDQITEDMLCFEKTGNMVYKQFINELLKPNSTKSIHEPLKKVMLNTCKSAIKPKKLKINDKTKELRGNCNLFARCALIRGQRDIDMKVVVGDYELTDYPKSLFSSDGSLLDGSKSKSEAVTELLKYTEYVPSDNPPANPDSVVIDAMRVLNEMATKRFKTGKDLVNEFRRRIEVISSNAMLQTVVFDTYSAEPSLKDKTRISRKKRSLPPRDFNISLEKNIEKITMSELLSSSVTKRSITELLMQQIIDHMEELNVNYVVAGNHKTYWSLNGQTNQEENDHEEADTLMIRCLKLGSDALHTNVVSVYSADTDVFFCCCLIQIS